MDAPSFVQIPVPGSAPSPGTGVAYRTDSLEAVQRVDVCRLDGSKVTRTPVGGLRIPAYPTREGVFIYRNADGTSRREYRPASEVFATDSLASLEDAAVTDLHPKEKVTLDNVKEFQKGKTRDVHQDGKLVAAVVLVEDKDLIAAVERKDRVELSCGYDCEYDPTPGVTPTGERYDGIQRNIRYNHVALLPSGWGRAGSEVRLRLDAAIQDEDTVKIERIDGVEYEVGSDPWRQALARHDAKIAADAKALADAAAAVASEKARADKAEAELDQATKALAIASDPKRVDAAVEARTALVTRVVKVMGASFKTDGVSDLDLQKAVIGKLDPELKLDGKDASQIGYDFEAVCRYRADGLAEAANQILRSQLPNFTPTAAPESVKAPAAAGPAWALSK